MKSEETILASKILSSIHCPDQVLFLDQKKNERNYELNIYVYKLKWAIL